MSSNTTLQVLFVRGRRCQVGPNSFWPNTFKFLEYFSVFLVNYPSEWVSTRQLVWDEGEQSSDTIGPKKKQMRKENPLGLDIVPVDWGQTGLKRMWRHLLRFLFTFLSKKAIITCPRRKEEVKKSAQMAHIAITELHVECGRSWYERSVHVTRDMSCLATVVKNVDRGRQTINRADFSLHFVLKDSWQIQTSSLSKLVSWVG